MKKKLNPVLLSVIVLSCIAVACAGILVVANKFLAVSDAERLARALRPLINADSFPVVYDKDADDANGGKVRAFNTQYGTPDKNYVSKAYLATGGENDGKYIIESAGTGFREGLLLILTAYNKDGTIMGISVKEYSGDKNSYYKNLKISSLNDAIKGKKGDIGGAEDWTGTAGSGATYTLRGVIDAINIANTFHEKIILGVTARPLLESDAAMLELINGRGSAPGLFSLAAANGREGSNEKYGGKTFSEYVSYPIRIAGSNHFDSAAITNVYVCGSGGDVILRITSGSGYGAWTIYALMDSGTAGAAADSATIAAVVHTAGGGVKDEEGGWDATALANDEKLTALFAGVTSAYIDALDKYITVPGVGITSGTQTNNGIKAAMYCALDKFDDVLNEIMAWDTVTEEAING